MEQNGEKQAKPNESEEQVPEAAQEACAHAQAAEQATQREIEAICLEVR